MSDLVRRIADNLARVRQRIADRAARSGRSADEIALVAVTKYVGEAEVRALVEAGCTVLGESRPQQLWPKAETLRDLPIRWHMVGHLQRNKARRTLPLVEMVHSADTPQLVETIDRIAGELGRPMPILLEINVSGESAKHGFAPGDVEPLLAQLPGYANVKVRGLMCMAGFHGSPEAARRDFAALRELRDRLRPNCPEAVPLEDLSMGMSGDYEVAIEEGATIVRIGSAWYEGVL